MAVKHAPYKIVARNEPNPKILGEAFARLYVSIAEQMVPKEHAVDFVLAALEKEQAEKKAKAAVT